MNPFPRKIHEKPTGVLTYFVGCIVTAVVAFLQPYLTEDNFDAFRISTNKLIRASAFAGIVRGILWGEEATLRTIHGVHYEIAVRILNEHAFRLKGKEKQMSENRMVHQNSLSQSVNLCVAVRSAEESEELRGDRTKTEKRQRKLR